MSYADELAYMRSQDRMHDFDTRWENEQRCADIRDWTPEPVKREPITDTNRLLGESHND